jgi:L-ribulose-5-phosphate 3-epimerase
MSKIGIMQGRLVPPTENRFQCFPRENWDIEFENASKANIDCIEWIYDLYGAGINPLSTDTGIEKIKNFSAKFGVQVLSVCADYFMERTLVRASDSEITERLNTLEWLMHRCYLLKMNRLVLPFVDASSINNNEELESVIKILDHALTISEETGVEIHLETSLEPNRFAYLLSRLPHPMLKVNYDSGNSSSLGYLPQDEFSAYGDRVGSVHIKDRIRGGSTVPLGEGDADFLSLFECLKNINYSGDFILQVARGIPGDEVNLAKINRAFTLNFL